MTWKVDGFIKLQIDSMQDTFPPRQISWGGAEVTFNPWGEEKPGINTLESGRREIPGRHLPLRGCDDCASWERQEVFISTPSPIGSPHLSDCSSHLTSEPRRGTRVARPRLFYLEQQKIRKTENLSVSIMQWWHNVYADATMGRNICN